MPTYDVYFTTTASTVIRVEAEDKNEAVDKAYEEGEFPTICAQCSGWGRNYNLDLGDTWEALDGENDVFEVDTE